MHIALLVIPDCLIVALGWVLLHKLKFSREFFTNTEKLVYYILFPALLVRSIAFTPISASSAGRLLAVSILLCLAGYLAAWLARPILKPRPIALASLAQCAYRFNTYIGFSLAAALAGSEGQAIMAVLVGFSVPIANVLAVKSLARFQGSNVWLEILKNPLVLATLAGLLLNFSGIGLDNTVDMTLSKLGNSAIPLGLLCVGASLSLAGGSQDRAVISWILGIRLMVMPVFALILAFLLALSPLETTILVLFAALPPASAAYILAARMGGDGRCVATAISIGTVFSVITIPFWLFVGQNLVN
ncbi:MAG TPA: AEC family transporter [Advenella sp.]|nr:AEC family transporter [Advenella sp.]